MLKRLGNVRSGTWIWVAVLTLVLGMGVRSLWWSDYAECIRGRGFWVDSNNGALSVGLMIDANAESFLFSTQSANRVWTWLPDWIAIEVPGGSRRMWELVVPYWLILALMTGTWWLGRWWRRKRLGQG